MSRTFSPTRPIILTLEQLREWVDQFRYDVAAGAYGYLIVTGIVDPTKVTRSAVQNAVSITGLILTTDAMVAELPQPVPAGPSEAGGMGF